MAIRIVPSVHHSDYKANLSENGSALANCRRCRVDLDPVGSYGAPADCAGDS